MKARTEIGFSQRVQLNWLERTAELLQAGTSKTEIQSILDQLLASRLSVGGDAPRGNRGKAVSILLNTWVSVPGHLTDFRDEGLDHLTRLPTDQHLSVHWGMVMAAYPFFATVAETTGRLVRLQGTVTTPQVVRRVSEQLGQRETVIRAVRRTLTCFLDWGVLRPTAERAIYEAAPPQPITDTALAPWLIEAILRSREDPYLPLKQAIHSPSTFPLSLSPFSLTAIGSSARLELLRQGVDEDLVALKARKLPQQSTFLAS